MLVSEMRERRSGRGWWLIEFNGESWSEPYEFTAESPEERDRILTEAGLARWLPDNEVSLDLADGLWPYRLRSRRQRVWRRVTALFAFINRQ